jgi:hypothetical protein
MRARAQAGGVATPAKPAQDLVEITLERRRPDGSAEAMAAGHVFAAGDYIRLKLTSHSMGYLYVLDQGSSGHSSTVFPAADTGMDNRVMPDKVYLLPAAGEGWFEVSGPAGFDVLYFLLSPTPFSTPTAASFAMPGPVSSMRPRCNDQIFKARGECMDDSAGPAAVPANAVLPEPLQPVAGQASRDIVFKKETGQTTGVSGASGAPMIYTFRLAHQ